MEVLLILGSVIAFLIWAFIEARKEWKAEAQKELENRIIMDERLKHEMTKPFFKIEFIDVNHKIYHTNHFIPQIVSYRFKSLPTSFSRAENYLKASMEKGYVTDKDGVVFPTCNVLNAKVVQHVGNVVNG